VSADTEMAFEFNKTLNGPTDSSGDELSVQAQIKFIRSDGSKCLHVVTTRKKVTTDRTKAETGIDVSAIGLNAIQQAAKLGQAGNFKDARVKLHVTQKLLKRGAKTDTQAEEYANFVTQSDLLDSVLRECVRVKKFNGEKVKLSDDAAKAFVKAKMANRTLLFSGVRKKEVVSRRQHTDSALKDMYYNIRF